MEHDCHKLYPLIVTKDAEAAIALLRNWVLNTAT